MALKRLPNDVQSLLCASVQVKSYKRAVEELVFNSLDSESISIAIRTHIQGGTMQVIDNGYGITKHDFNTLGQRYMTSKITDISTLKAAPKTYGYRGEFLANIIAVSQMVKITSRHENTEETWAKTFFNGKEKKFAKMSTRPTKGTTVDIKGFLYNLNIQKRGINPINELQNIKLFLEQLSLVHNNISLSLRDDSKNEIIFKIHKKRDIYQTLSTLFDINKADLQELQVEKSEYKVKGMIGKTDKELDLHWIYLNGKFIHGSSKLHKVINEHLKKCLLIKDQRKIKSKKNTDEQLFSRNIPFYFTFITCPYIDYDINFTSTHSVIEFKNWEQMNKLLEKLIKFYVGDVNLKEIKKSENKMINNEKKNIDSHQDTKDQVKKIMNKILGSNSKKLGVSQLQNGVKGKLVTRKIKKKAIKKSANISTLFRKSDNQKPIDDKDLSKSKIEINFEPKAEGHNKLNNNLNESKEHKTLRISKHHNKKMKAPNPKKYKQEEMQVQKNKTKAKNLSPTRKTDKTSLKQKKLLNKHKKLRVHNNDCRLFKRLKETDSVYKRTKIVAQKAEEFLQHHIRKRNANVTQKENNLRQGKKNMITKRYDNNAFNDNVPRTRPINKYIVNNYVMNKLKTKAFKTTYDLVQTILISQQEEKYCRKNNVSKECYSEFSAFNYRHNDKLYPKRSTWINKYIVNEYSDIDGKQRKPSEYTTSVPVQYKTYSYEDNFSEYSGNYGQKEISNYMPSITEEFRFGFKDILNTKNHNIKCRPPETSHCTLDGSLWSKLTYESHHYQDNVIFEPNVNANIMCSINKRQNVRFITKQSRDNFATVNDFTTKYLKRPSKLIFNTKQTKINDIHATQIIDEYTIEYSKSNENNNSNQACSDILVNSADFIINNDNLPHETNVNHENKLPDNEQYPIIGNTYTIQPSYVSFGMNIESNQIIKSNEFFNTYSIHYSNPEVNNDITCKPIINKDEFAPDRNNINVVFVSKSQCSETDTPLDNNIEPLNVCETILHESDTIEREFAFSFNQTNNQLNDFLYDNIGNIEHINERFENEPFQITTHHSDVDCAENISYHFSNAVNTKQSNVIDNINANLKDSIQTIRRNKIDQMNEIRSEHLPNPVIESVSGNGHNINCNIDSNYFTLKNRLSFVPKGMSQIFENCHSKTTLDYDVDKDYYEDSIYNNFANDVQVNSEIYEPIIQNVEDLTTKNIYKFQTKVKKDNASLVFDETSLKEAKVLGQADCKFIAAIMKNRCDELEEATEYLILFDQHAVHERIRLEKNLADYINEDRWRSVPLDNVLMKISNDEIIYLHNYKDKFTQLGLQWTILNDNEVTVNSIPEAILGKNPREVEKVIKAVRNLIIEEINIIKLQKGCVSLYPKSIMDLVFSEACRYAIKFGDQLSKNYCVELLTALSDCKTPFQCAHGRPVMAVIIDIKYDNRDYKINKAKLNQFKRRNTTNL